MVDQYDGHGVGNISSYTCTNTPANIQNVIGFHPANQGEFIITKNFQGKLINIKVCNLILPLCHKEKYM